jgi:hypothetical protein
MFHIELRQFPHNHSRFNMSEAELRAILEPWVRETAVELGERKWSPHTARLTILEGPQLDVQELSMGRGWRAAQRQSVEVTEQLLARAKEAANAADAAARDAAPAAVSAPIPLPASSTSAAELTDPLAFGVQLASLLGRDPARLLAAWRDVAARSRELSPSDALAIAERELENPAANPR